MLITVAEVASADRHVATDRWADVVLVPPHATRSEATVAESAPTLALRCVAIGPVHLSIAWASPFPDLESSLNLGLERTMPVFVIVVLLGFWLYLDVTCFKPATWLGLWLSR
jgi:hypothetical protein